MVASTETENPVQILKNGNESGQNTGNESSEISERKLNENGIVDMKMQLK